MAKSMLLQNLSFKPIYFLFNSCIINKKELIYMSDFSKRLSALREQKGWTKTYVAKQIGLTSMQTYANYEYGRREPDFETTKKLANLFNVSTDYLLGRTAPDEDRNTADLADDDTIFTFEGKPIPEQDLEYMKRLLRGGRK